MVLGAAEVRVGGSEGAAWIWDMAAGLRYDQKRGMCARMSACIHASACACLLGVMG
jgi:hypothetical protein